MARCWARRLIGILGGILWTTSAAGQIQTGEIFGRVYDPSGAATPGVTVTLQSTALITPRSAIASATGAYRFPSLPVGIYGVKFELAGFKTVVRSGIALEAGFSAEIDAELPLATIDETVVVAGATPIVDPKRISTGQTFARDHLDAIPSVRDPWGLLEQTTGIVMDRQNVGGNKSGAQSFFTVHGGNPANTMWNVDGVTITDLAQTGASPAFYDFDSFEEIRINTGGNDASLQTGGVNINLITRSGGNTYRGSGRFFVADKALQSGNVDAELRAQAAGAGNPMKNLRDYGAELGGPVRKGKAWFWGGYGSQRIGVGVLGFLKPGATDPDNPENLETDLTVLVHHNAKVNWQWAPPHKTTILLTRSNKERTAVNAGPNRPLETTQRQSNPIMLYKVAHQWVPTHTSLFEMQAAYVDVNIDFDFQSPDLGNVQRLQDIDTGRWSRSWIRSRQRRPTTELKFDGHAFVSGRVGGDHSLRFGLRYRDTPENGHRHIGGFATARLDGGVAVEADLHRDSMSSKGMYVWSSYVTDSYQRGKVHLNVGLRTDYQDDTARPASVSANPIVPDLLPALDFRGADSGVKFFDISPRVGLTYDVFDRGKTLVKAAGAVYYGQGIFTAEVLDPVSETTIRLPWTDANGDRLVQHDELVLQRLLSFSSNYDPTNPASTLTPTSVDPQLRNNRTSEIIAGVEHELIPNLVIGASYIWRRYDRFDWTPTRGIASSDFAPVSRSFDCGNTSCDQPRYVVTYFELPFTPPATKVLTNRNFERKHHGWEFTARKRFAHRWLLNGSLALNDTRQYIEEFQDPTNVSLLHGAQDNSRNSRWVAKITGLYSFPQGISVAGFLNARDGYPFERTVRSPNRRGGLGRVNVSLDRFGDMRFEDLWMVDMRLDKRFSVHAVTVTASLDVFNVTNANIVLSREGVQNISTANRVLEVLAPRIVRLGLRFSF